MRKIIVSMNITLDGFMSGPNGELDWHFRYWNEDMARCAGEKLSSADTILLGRKTYTVMEQYWPGRLADQSFPREDLAYAGMMNNHKKLVVSKTLTEVCWESSELLSNNIFQTLAGMKEQSGKHIMVYGSGLLVNSLRFWNLIDSYQLWLHPVTLGKGRPLFVKKKDEESMELVNTRWFQSGVLLMEYDLITPFLKQNLSIYGNIPIGPGYQSSLR